MSVRQRTTYYIDHEGREFPVQFAPVEGTEIVKINGNKASSARQELRMGAPQRLILRAQKK